MLFSTLAFGEARVDEMCKPLSRAKRWHKGDTVYYSKRVAPAYKEIVEQSKYHAVRNNTFKQALSSYDYTADKVNDHNRLRLQKECDITQLNNSNACHHFQAYCLNSISTETLNKSFDSFNNCAINRSEYCGESFQTPEGILANLRELDKAATAIFEVQDDIREDPNMLEYFGDIQDTFDELKLKLAQAKENAKESAQNLEKEIEEKYARMKSEDENFNNCCSILDQCDDYLKKEGYEDKFQLMNQTVFCKLDNQYGEDELTPLENLLNGLNGHQEKQNLKDLAINSLNNATAHTVKEYASTYKALYGNKPSSSQMCKDLPDFCQNKVAKDALYDSDLSNVPKMDVLQEIKTYNEQAKKMNQLCKQAQAGFVDKELEKNISEQLYLTMYKTKMGQLMGVKNFRDKVPPFDQEACYEDGVGFKPISENTSGENFVKDGIKSILGLQKDKAQKLNDQRNQVTYAGTFTDPTDKDYYRILKDIVRNDPYMIRETIKSSGNPDHALWICKATADIYQTEKWETIGTWVGTGLAIAGSLVATIFTFGGAAPLLVGSVAMATGVGVYNLNHAYTAKHNAEQSMAIQSAERVFSSMNMKNIDGQVKAAYVEIGMSLLPGALRGMQLTGKAVGPMLKSSQLLKTIPAGGKLTASSKALVDAIKNGRQVTKEMIQKALASKLPSANPDKIKTFVSILEGTSADMSVEMMVFASTYPDPPGPFSKEGMQALALSLRTSVAFNSLGPAGRQWVLKRKAVKLNKIMVRAQNEMPSVIVDANNPMQRPVLVDFAGQVKMTDNVVKLMDNAHNAPSGFAKNKQIKLLIDEISTQPGMSRAKAENLVLGVDNGSGVRVGGLASTDVMILGTEFNPVKVNSLSNVDCAQVDCASLIKYVKHSDANMKIDPFEPIKDVKKKIHTQIQNADVSTHGDKHLKSDINSEKDFKTMSSKEKSQGQYFNLFKDKIKNKSQFEKELLRNENIGYYDFTKRGVMYKYVSFDDFKKAYPDFAKDMDGFGWGADCNGLAKFMRIELTNSESPMVHSHPRCLP